MSEALERVIAEQQTKIDQLTAEVTRGHETLNTIWTKHNDLFESFARLIGGMLQRGVPVDKKHPYRVQVDEGEAVIVNIKKAIADSLGVQE